MNKPVRIKFDRLSTGEVFLFGLAFAILLALGGYMWHLQSRAEKLQRKWEVAEQRKAALEDSLRKVGSYESDSLGLRELFAKLDMPTTRPDTLGGGRVQGETESRTELSVDPGPASGSNEVPADTSAEDSLTYQFSEQVGRYRLTGPARVSLQTGTLSYDFRIDGGPIQLSIYKSVRSGQRETVIDAPGSVDISGVQGYSRPNVKEEEFNHYSLRVPIMSFRPNITGGLAVGATITARTQLPLGTVGFVEAGLHARPSFPATEIVPTGRAGLKWNF